ncbi:hypothetical protein RJ641_035215 [Dillenia turbinata]|uniref:Uncharacterized protein n=1 Tax=Dillenia turbinata TaxID=194707 RepID=A0AAN8VJ68_9MAGN
MNRNRVNGEKRTIEYEGSRTSRRPQQDAHEGYKKNEGFGRHGYDQHQANRHDEVEQNNDGWEIVGKKPARQHPKMDHWQGYERRPSEQEYMEDAEPGVSLEPSEVKLSDLLQACNKLWELDLNH